MTATRHGHEPVVFVVDDDEPLRNAIASLLQLVGLRAECFSSAQEFLQRTLPDAPSCLILDVRLPGVSGLNVQEDLAKAGIPIPIIFVTAHGDIPMSVRAMKAGAFEFLPKPFRDQDMLDAVHLALSKDRARRDREQNNADLRTRFATLTPREREIVGFVASGMVNKQIAAKLGLADITVKIHRGSAMRKLEAGSLAELLKMTQTLGLGGDT
jgi:FixJ family two-component response regulator